jgi:hypothetical protein
MKTITFMIAFTAIGLLGSIAFVDAKELTAEVPFDYQNSGCTLVEDTPDYKRYECDAEWKSENYKEPASRGWMSKWNGY